MEKIALLVTMMCGNTKQCVSHLFKIPIFFLFLFNLLRKCLLPMIPHVSVFYRTISSWHI